MPAALLLAVVLALTAGGFAPTQAAVLPTAVSGKVVADGQPVADATVAFLDGSKNVVNSVTTGADGTYSTSLESGSYRVRFAAAGYQTQYWSGKYTFASADTLSLLLAGRGDIDASLTRPPTLSGHVTGGGRPAAGIEVTATGTTESGEPASDTTTTDAAGAYRLTTPIGSYTLHFGGTNRLAPEYYQDAATSETATPVAVGVGGTTGVDADLGLNPYIAGTVLSPSGDPVEGATVDVTSTTADGPQDSGTTDPRGAFRVRMPAGAYVLQVSAADFATEYYDDAATADQATPVTLGSSNVTLPKVITLAADRVVSGTVKDPSGQPVKARVTAFQLDGTTWSSEVASTRTAADGSYALTLRPGDYRLRFEAAGHVTEYWNDAATIASGTTISVTRAADVTAVDAVLQPVLASLSGTVSTQGQPLAGATATAEVRGVKDGQTTWTAAGSATSDASGRYAFAELPDGTYRLRFARTGYLPEYYDNQTDAAKAKAVTVQAGQPVVADADLELGGGVINGVVSGPSGPLSNIAVTAYDASGQSLGSVATDAKGEYYLFLSPGEYRLRFDSANGRYATEFYRDAATLATATKVTVDRALVPKINATLAERKPLTGTVTGDKGAAVPFASVSLLDPSDAHVVTTTNADSSGAYTLYAAPGTYTLDVFGGDSYQGTTRSVTLTSAGGTADVSLSLRRFIHGAVLAPGGKDGVTGAKVTAYARVDGAWVSRGYAYTNQGAYDLPVDPGTYRLEISGHDVDLSTTYYDGAADLASAQDVVVTSKDDAGYFTTTLAKVSGIKATVTRQGPAEGQADALRLDLYRYDAVDDRWVAADSVDVEPGTELAELPAGTYKIRYREVTHTDDGDELGPVRYFDGAASFEAAKPVTVASDTIVPVALTYGVKPVFTNTVLPTISGTVRVGETLTAKPGTWTPAGATYSYQWLSNGQPIEDATTSTYTVTPKDLGEKISVRVTASRTDYTTGVATSAEQVAAAGRITVVKAPKITGTAALGKTLKATSGTWTPDGLTYSYQWRRDTKAISGATKTSYQLTKADVGHEVTVTVTARRTGYAAVAKSSAATAKVRTTSKLSVSASSPRAGRVVVKVSVSAPGTTATGTVTIKRGSTTVARGPLTKGKVTFTLTAEPRGKRTYTATYGGSSVVPKDSGNASVTVR